MSWTAEQTAAADRAVTDLESQRLGAWNLVLTTWAADDAARQVSVDFLGNSCITYIAQLRQQEGVWDYTKWVGQAVDLQKTIADIAGYTDDWSMKSVLYATADQTATETAALAKKGLTWGLGTFTFVALGIVAWKVLR